MGATLAHERRLGRRSTSTRTALHLRPGLSFDEWKRIGREVQLVDNASTWWIGDWLVYGEQEYGGRYRSAIDATGLEYQTLRNRAWVASRFPPANRRESLSFGHHAEVAALPEEDRKLWLDRAFLQGWSRNDLRRNLREERSPRSTDTVTVALAVPPDRCERWRAAASADRRDLREWIEDALDRAAELVLRSVDFDDATPDELPAGHAEPASQPVRSAA